MDKVDLLTARERLALCDSRAEICKKQLRDVVNMLAALTDGITEAYELLDNICNDAEG